MFQSGFLPLGQVHLGGVSGNDGLAVRAEPCEEHFHLGNSGVLGLVQDDESPLEGATAHVGEGSNLDGARFFVTTEFFWRKQFREAVVDGTQIRGNFFFQVARQVT